MPSLLSFLSKKSEIIKIQSSLGTEECRAALKNATVNDSTFKTMFVDSGTILCKFDGDSFRLRQKRSYRNSFAPFFYGKLSQTMTGTEISGEFRLHPFVMAFMTLWFGLLLVIGGTMAWVSLVQLVTGHSNAKNANPIMGLLVPVIMLVFGVALVKFGKWLARSEEDNISNLLKETFSADKDSSLVSSIRTPAKKIVMTIPMLVFAGMGILSLVFCFSGISSYTASASSNDMAHSGTGITYYYDQWGRWLSFANGVFLCVMAYGIWKRIYLVWKLGFVLIALSGISFIFQVLGDPHFFAGESGGPPLFLIIFAFAGAVAVCAYWTFWWYKKKDYFAKEKGNQT